MFYHVLLNVFDYHLFKSEDNSFEYLHPYILISETIFFKEFLSWEKM